MRFRNKLMAGVAAVALASAGMGSTYALWSKNVSVQETATLKSGSMKLQVLSTQWYKQHIGRNNVYDDLIFTRQDGGLVYGNDVEATPVPDLSTYRPVPGDVLIRVTQLKVKLEGTNLKAQLAISHVDLPQYWQLGITTTNYVGGSEVWGDTDYDVVRQDFNQSAPDVTTRFLGATVKNDTDTEAYVTETFYFDSTTAERNGALSQLTFPAGTVTLQQMRR